MGKKCKGCGVGLQDNNVLLEGFTTNLTNDYCARCFRMKHYGEYQLVVKSNDEFIEIIKNIGTTRSLVIYVVDVLNIPKNISNIKEYMPNNDIILVLNKSDLLPKSVIENKIIDYFKNMNLGFLDVIMISALTNYNLDLLYSMINKYRTTKNVYVVGNTNAGKSMLINKFIKNYMAGDEILSISAMPSTTLNEIKLEIGDFFIIDTPGLVDSENIINYVDADMLKKISPKKEIKPRIFQIKKNQSILIDDIMRVDYAIGDRNSIIFFMSNDIKIKKINFNKPILKDLMRKEIDVKYREDVVINGLGFIKVIDECKLIIWINKETDIFTRKSLI
ncbi:MAG TPA: 50S ribosome-binding GTPase [Bacilli bacterium]|nr:50S ribosome-binding GTPase [Bacilli bacterium]